MTREILSASLAALAAEISGIAKEDQREEAADIGDLLPFNFSKTSAD